MNTDTLSPSKDRITEDGLFELNVTLIEPKLKHPTIFRHFDELQPGEAFRIHNDHDPKPLYYQLIGERGNVFSWTYLQKGPEWWDVEIRRNDAAKGESIGEIAAKDLRKAEVFKKYGIDFCCGGKKTLREVCLEKGLDFEAVEADLGNTVQAPAPAFDFNKWDADFLADYVYNQHHKYYYTEEPTITGLMEKVADHHGGPHNNLHQLRTLYRTLVQELNTHFMKEERVVFPFVKALVTARNTGNMEQLSQQPSLTEPIQIMESDHEAAGGILDQMSQLTGGYTAPENACNSYQFLFKKLKELDEDLHQHIHLENNLLFPKALSIEKELKK
jgi:regulator of cell morphogenesis and NO signaling